MYNFLLHNQNLQSMFSSTTKVTVKLSEVKSNLTKSQNLSINEQQSVKGGCATCTEDLRRKDLI